MMLTNDLITSENVSKDLLKAIYDAAFMETAWDDDGDLKINEDIGCSVFISDNQEKITFLRVFRFEEGVSRADRLEFVNRINDKYSFVRAMLTTYDTLAFDHDLFIKGGISKKNLVLATRFFLSIPLDAINDCGEELVA
ncbi:YbjN domain-containing protein [Synechococcus elongatus]|uniref:Osmotic signal transduction related protein n=3 Tax=Synechococcus elongatus TaxID=32046 RepID=Q31PB3_SYNE7|nr:YbjN domain-containing protein [Synechococcus elongatus]ABB57106.1 osmotic signal transduction related protein [Synechococcus elongatus PCC 7942 = FACHB-805]AJD58377.1 ornithine acetyltransferase [Synechococcus elongatus UTEX 2973]MBD2587507.1 YbjN domain-containing protein [Synechococcus elongatus FACHB-242]MBD2688714.1 YbjN domain-containing protein [Synechococcus elongatus FACHB-1061]MBD2707785.1 YbjN domain-containing protein [Synechococcus elongatus PCC 7942 = FACHB-805]